MSGQEECKVALKKPLTNPKESLLYLSSSEDRKWLSDNTPKLEGVAGKRVGSLYWDGTRSRDWVNVKRPGAAPVLRFQR